MNHSAKVFLPCFLGLRKLIAKNIKEDELCQTRIATGLPKIITDVHLISVPEEAFPYQIQLTLKGKNSEMLPLKHNFVWYGNLDTS
jgi:hypothetical protein